MVSGEFPFAATFSEKKKKNGPEKFPFVATNDWNLSAVQIPWYYGKVRQKKEKLAIPKRYVLKANAINTFGAKNCTCK